MQFYNKELRAVGDKISSIRYAMYPDGLELKSKDKLCLSQIERGKSGMTVRQLMWVAELLGVSPMKFLDIDIEATIDKCVLELESRVKVLEAKVRILEGIKDK